MSNKNLIQIREFCLYHEIENTFITELKFFTEFSRHLEKKYKKTTKRFGLK